MAETFVIAQGGGPTAVINQTMVGATLEVLRRHPGARVLGARHGVRGVRDGDYVVLSDVPEAQLRLIAGTPSAALGSTRDKPDAAYCDKVLEGLKKVSADAFIYIGGNDTSGTQQILTDASGGSIAFVHAPKTIDNDLMENDHTPGFISAAEFVAGAFLSVDLDFRALPGVYVAIVMGRHAGFLTAASAAWRLDEDSGPHLIYVPERAFSVPRFIDDVRAQARPPQTLHRRRFRRRVHRGRAFAGRDHRARGAAGARCARQSQAVRRRPRPRLRACAARRAARPAGAGRCTRLHAARLDRGDQQGRPAGSLRRRRPCCRGGGPGRRLGGAAVSMARRRC